MVYIYYRTSVASHFGIYSIGQIIKDFLLLTLKMMYFSMKYVSFGLERAEGFGPQIGFRMNSPLLSKQTGIWRILLLIVSDNMFTFKDRI